MWRPHRNIHPEPMSSMRSGGKTRGAISKESPNGQTRFLPPHLPPSGPKLRENKQQSTKVIVAATTSLPFVSIWLITLLLIN
jgi:hypothetical protein